MENSPWQRRAKAAGLKQSVLAKLLGKTPKTVSQQLQGLRGEGVSQEYKSAIVAWEIMTEEQRREWLARVQQGEDE